MFSRGRSQTSVKSTGTGVESSGIYCTAWFNHGTSPSGKKTKYVYTVQVDAEPVGEAGKDSITPKSFYRVKRQNQDAHVVRFQSANGRGIVHGYVVFPVAPVSPITFTRGPLSSIHHQSIIMVEEKTGPDKFYISATSPKLNMQTKSGSPPWCNSGNTNPVTMDNLDETLLYCSKSTDQSVRVDLRNAPSTLKSLHVGGTDKTSDKNDYVQQGSPSTRLTFLNLRNGADTEILF